MPCLPCVLALGCSSCPIRNQAGLGCAGCPIYEEERLGLAQGSLGMLAGLGGGCPAKTENGCACPERPAGLAGLGCEGCAGCAGCSRARPQGVLAGLGAIDQSAIETDVAAKMAADADFVAGLSDFEDSVLRGRAPDPTNLLGYVEILEQAADSMTPEEVPLSISDWRMSFLPSLNFSDPSYDYGTEEGGAEKLFRWLATSSSDLTPAQITRQVYNLNRALVGLVDTQFRPYPRFQASVRRYIAHIDDLFRNWPRKFKLGGTDASIGPTGVDRTAQQTAEMLRILKGRLQEASLRVQKRSAEILGDPADALLKEAQSGPIRAARETFYREAATDLATFYDPETWCKEAGFWGALNSPGKFVWNCTGLGKTLSTVGTVAKWVGVGLGALALWKGYRWIAR